MSNPLKAVGSAFKGAAGAVKALAPVALPAAMSYFTGGLGGGFGGMALKVGGSLLSNAMAGDEESGGGYGPPRDGSSPWASSAIAPAVAPAPGENSGGLIKEWGPSLAMLAGGVLEGYASGKEADKDREERDRRRLVTAPEVNPETPLYRAMYKEGREVL